VLKKIKLFAAERNNYGSLAIGVSFLEEKTRGYHKTVCP
jgi:hypothetical protein